MKSFQSIRLKKHPRITPTLYTNPDNGLYCVEITVEKHTEIDIFFKTMGDLVDFVEKLARQIEPVGERK